jgi:hypothetical protein
MKRILLSALGILSLAGTANATPFVLPSGQALDFKFNNSEQVDTNGGNDLDVPGTLVDYGDAGNWGILLVSTIENGDPTAFPHSSIPSTGDIIFSNGLSGGQVYGLFYDIDLTGPQSATGGTMDLYWHDGGGLSLPGTPTDATVDAFTTGTFLARINFASGIDAGNCGTTITSTVDPTLGVSGFADSFGSVDTGAGGLWASALDGNWFNTPCGTRDIRFRNSFNSLPGWNGTNAIGLSSTDPAQVFTAPEPATLTLLGFGLGLAGMRLRRKANTNV